MNNLDLYSQKIEDYQPIVGRQMIQEIKKYAHKLIGKHIVMVNSTPTGGGVAEILTNMVLILNKLRVNIGWRILKGPEDFFQITKEFHNGLQGAGIDLTTQKKKLYELVNYNNSLMNHIGNHDLVVVHDPQPLALINFYQKKAPWIWRCHIDISQPDKKLFSYLKPFIEKYDAMIVSSEVYQKKSLSLKQVIIPPSIDPLSVKNHYLSRKQATTILRKHDINLTKPVISQVSRFDRWKDPLGVIAVYREVKKKFDCQLVLLGNLAMDDPEGPMLYKKVMEQVKNDPDISVICVTDHEMVNALQTVSDVVVQKSTKEGFALTVSEALWKSTPVVGTKVGGIPLQVINGKTGYLAKNNKEAVDACLKLLKNKKLANKLGKQGKEHVRKNFLITRHILDYLKLFDHYLNK